MPKKVLSTLEVFQLPIVSIKVGACNFEVPVRHAFRLEMQFRVSNVWNK